MGFESCLGCDVRAEAEKGRGYGEGTAYQWCWTRIDELMLCTCRHDH